MDSFLAVYTWILKAILVVIGLVWIVTIPWLLVNLPKWFPLAYDLKNVWYGKPDIEEDK